MPDRLRLTILGCGSSPGTPRINGDWGNCDPANPRNRRSRASAMLERVSDAGTTRIVIDTGPDFRNQMLSAGVERIDAAVYTHPHADHIHGIDDLRGYALAQRQLIDIHADRPTMHQLKQSFGYCFKTPPGSSYPPILNPITFAHEVEFAIDGPGGPIALEPLPFIHGDIIALGFRIGQLAYCPDVSDIPHMTAERLAGLDLLVINALQYKTHPSHLSLDQALEWIEQLAPRRAVLTHMHIPLDYNAVARATPDHVEPAYDGMQHEFEITSS